ncbi:MAG TPA: TIGR03619 family F420-dependent LLM class oxidoreductase [Microthrixaceae bacterium]|nr:TIGR03619 family F420-dependent LLM class oxidoreductase [Microthrixaceae bacterium]
MRFSHALLGAEPRDYAAIAQAAEAAGFDSVALSDHVFYPEELSSSYPYTSDGKPQYQPEESWPDPWVMVGAMAGVTTDLRFMTNVYVLPLRNPFVVAKAVGTAAHLSGDRVILGIGAGWMREEFDQLGQPFGGRGARMEEMVEALRMLWRGGMVEHHGPHFDFDRLEMAPAPERPVPIYIGGTSEIALRRAARIGDGWIGMYHSVEELGEITRFIAHEREQVGRAELPFDVVASPPLVPKLETVHALEESGVTTILTSSWMARGQKQVSQDEAVEMIAAYGDRFIAPLGA